MAAVAELALMEHGGESDDATSSTDAGEASQSRSFGRAVALVVSASLGLAAMAGFATMRHGHVAQSSGHRAQLWETVFPFQSVADDTNHEFMDTVAGLPGIPYSQAELENLRHPPKEEHKPDATTPQFTTLPPIPTTDPDVERAVTNSNDCFYGEEYFAGVCYKNCSVLTAGRYPIRSSPNTCCSAEPCIFPSHLSFSGPFICTGYAVDSKGGCPRKPGHCGKDEEMYEGMCYKPCTVLTAAAYPHRVGPMTCCKFEPPCFSFANLKSEGFAPCTGYDVGGEGHDCAHEPH
mmetsp:Transcript_26481/g.61532  ORF Transcript_26481/g.61532 Transcript_26481/m.61532 type:complete len:291 (+) Transcript_26481:72-944(+)